MKAIYRDRQKGAVAPLVGILMVVFVLCVAIVVDLGHLHNVKVQMQRAVDAAALAGAPQLAGGPSQDDDATAVAIATAAANKVAGKTGMVAAGGWVDGTSIVVTLGNWDPDRTQESRFSSPVAANTANAVKVTATMEVDHYFFYFAGSTTIVTDAIAVNIYQEQTIPVAVTSCIPTGGSEFPGVLAPGNTVNDIALYTFGSAIDDTAAWSSLTIEVTNSNNLEYFFDECGVRLFNKIVYGTNEAHDGIENESVKKGGCTTDDNLISVKDFTDLCNEPTNINCGLGDDYTPANPGDPLDFNPLPRWSDLEAIRRIWSMDGVLIQDVDDGETLTDFLKRLNNLRKASDFLDPYTFADYNAAYPNQQTSPGIEDDRFTRYIEIKKNGEPELIKNIHKKLLGEAGYPEVWLTEGVTETIDDFLGMIVLTEKNKLVGSEFKNNVLNENEPFDEEHKASSHGLGETVELTIPIIFTGSCSDTKYKTGLYIGTANLLLTRIWKTINESECYDAGDERAVELQTGADYSRFGSDKNAYDLPALVGNKLLCTKGFANSSFEGLLRPPAGDDETETGVQKIFLVE